MATVPLLVDSNTLSFLSTAPPIIHGYTVYAICKALQLLMLFGPSSSMRAAYRTVSNVILILASLVARSDVSLPLTAFASQPASPPNHQSQNGLVESHWKIACKMARSFLAEAHLPKSFWFWALHESVARMNLIPVKYGPNPSDITTPHKLYYGTPPDYHVLFPFGSISYYHHPQDGGRGNRNTFES